MNKFIYTIAIFYIIHCTMLFEDSLSQWEPDVRLTNDPWSSSTSLNNAWCVAANGNTVHVVWFDYRHNNGIAEIYYKRSSDGGLTWGADTRMTNDLSKDEFPSIAVSSSDVHIVWLHDQLNIYHKRSTDDGITWGATTNLSISSSNKWYPSLAVSGPNVNVVWTDDIDLNYEIYYKRSSDNGVTWGANTRLTNNTAMSQYSSIAVSGSNIHLVWGDLRDGNAEIYYKRSIDGGTTWGADTRLSGITFESNMPSITASGLNLHVVWMDLRDGVKEIYYKRSSDGGVTWGADTRLTYLNPLHNNLPSIAVSASNVYLVFGFNGDIYYKYSTDNGINWGAEAIINQQNSASGYSIAVSGSLINVVWEDGRHINGNSNTEIYYKRNPTGNIGINVISAEVPFKFSLSQNYPNPFNPSTKIRFNVPRSDVIKLVVYDYLGREVSTPVNQQLNPGTYEVDFDGSSLTTGIYFYKISTGNYKETKKMVLLK